MASTTTKDKKPAMKVLSLGLPHTGSLSMTMILSILGYKNIRHGMALTDAEMLMLSDAADATFSSLPTYHGKEWTLEDWEKLYEFNEGTTDLGSIFAEQLIKTYPDAKVVLTIRDFDAWFKSFNESLLHIMWKDPLQWFLNDYVLKREGVRLIFPISRKIALGFFEAQGVDEIRKNARRIYDQHHRKIREMVPADRLLIYKLGDGWGPLCEFLEKPVPDVEYPRCNEAQMMREWGEAQRRETYVKASKVILSWILGAGSIAAGCIFAWKRASGIMSVDGSW